MLTALLNSHFPHNFSCYMVAAAAAKLLQLCLTLCDPTDGYCTIIHSWNPFFDTDLFSISIYVKICSDYSSLLSFFSPKNVPGKTI